MTLLQSEGEAWKPLERHWCEPVSKGGRSWSLPSTGDGSSNSCPCSGSMEPACTDWLSPLLSFHPGPSLWDGASASVSPLSLTLLDTHRGCFAHPLGTYESIQTACKLSHSSSLGPGDFSPGEAAHRGGHVSWRKVSPPGSQGMKEPDWKCQCPNIHFKTMPTVMTSSH
jgi:hypothetical protein